MTYKFHFFIIVLAFGIACNKAPQPTPAAAQTPQTPTVAVTNVISQELARNLKLPGELQPFQDVNLSPKVQGFISWIGVDRGSEVKAGQVLVKLSAPEYAAQQGEAEAKLAASAATYGPVLCVMQIHFRLIT